MPAAWEQFWRTFRLVDLIDVVVIALFIYLALRWLKHRANVAAAVAAGFLTLLYVVARRLDMQLTLFVFQVGFTAMLVVLVLVFQADIRRAFERLAAFQPWRRKQAAVDHPEIEILAEAAGRLAEARDGALVVLAGREPLDRHLRGGIPLGGRLSVPLLLSIFQSDSPGHDGAVVAEEGKVRSFAVHLPLSENLQAVGRGGTRHTAALGLAERTDAFVIVVSQETGRISAAEHGQLTKLASPAELKTRLEQFHAAHADPLQRRPWYSVFLRNLGWKFGALLLAVFLWLALAYQADVVQRSYLAPIQFRNVPPNWRIEDLQPDEVRVAISGSERAVRMFDKAALVVSLSGEDLVEGWQDRFLTADHIDLPNDVELTLISPQRVSFSAYRTIAIDLPVKVQHKGRPADGYSVAGVQAQPASVRVRIRRQDRENVREISTNAVDISGRRMNVTADTTLLLPDDVLLEGGGRPNVTVTVRIVKQPDDNKPTGNPSSSSNLSS